MPSTRVNYDILVLIGSYTDVPTLVSMSELCRDARALTIPMILKDVKLTRDRHQVQQFCRFVLADSPSRARFIHSLRILCNSEMYGRLASFVHDVESGLVELFKQAVELRTLSISSSLGLMIRNSATLRSAILALPRLSSLVSDYDDNEGQQSRNIVRNSRSLVFVAAREAWYELTKMVPHLRKLELSPLPSPSCLADILAPHALTLEELTLGNHQENLPFGLELITQCVGVKRLVLHDFAWLRPLFKWFPNVRCLELNSSPDTKSTTCLDIVTLPRQMTFPSSWSNLDHVSGNVLDILASHLRCRIRRLSADAVVPSGIDPPNATCFLFTLFVQVARPVVLSLRFDRAVACMLLPKLQRCALRLKCLTLTILPYQSLFASWQPEDMLYFLSRLPQVLASFKSLIYLSLELCFKPEQEALVPISIFTTHLIPRVLQTMDWLEYFEVIWAEAGHGRSWWSKDPSGTERPRDDVRGFYCLPMEVGLAAKEKCLGLSVD
ncbi:hypothetical protein AcV5_008823 [Taiwanofungus camphoratus]|nr:hypothetical protein AcV5_008823 [Antrodia cinnamomea]